MRVGGRDEREGELRARRHICQRRRRHHHSHNITCHASRSGTRMEEIIRERDGRQEGKQRGGREGEEGIGGKGTERGW